MVVAVVVVLFPVLWVLRVATKTEQGFIADPASLGGGFTLDNFGAAWAAVDLGGAILDSLSITLPGAALATLVGAIPGALPPLIGWTAAHGSASSGGWALFAILFLWQIPHFMAIAWMYRDDYGQAGFPMLPVIEPDGRRTARQAVLYAAALLPVSLGPVLVSINGPIYFAVALLLSVALLYLAVRFATERSDASARRLFFGSITYLPLLMAAMVIDHASR